MVNTISDKVENQSDVVQKITSLGRRKSAASIETVPPASSPLFVALVKRLAMALGRDRVIPARDGKALCKWGDGEAAELDRLGKVWGQANMIGIRLDGLLLIDMDEYKPEFDADKALELRSDLAKFQFNDKPSTHYLYRMPDDATHQLYKYADNGHAITGVDLKWGKQLVYIKPGKQLCFSRLSSPPLAPERALRILRHDSKVQATNEAPDATRTRWLAKFRLNPAANMRAIEAGLTAALDETGRLPRDNPSAPINWVAMQLCLRTFLGTEWENWAIETAERFSDEDADVAHRMRNVETVYRPWEYLCKARASNRDLDDDDEADVTNQASRQLTPADNVELQLDGDRTNKGDLIRAYNTADNVRAVLRSSGLTLCVNQMNGQVELHSGAKVLNRPSQIESLLTSAMASNKVPEGAIRVHCPAIAEEVSYHPVVRQLEGKEWDGVDRVSEVLQTFNFKEPDYAIPVMRAWLRATIAAAHTERGFSSKLVPVLVGQQNAAKSSAIRRITELLPGAFTDQHFSPLSKDALIHAASHWVQEWAEMDRLTVKDMPAVKAYISSMSDSFRRPYARTEETKPRQGTIIGTANIGSDTGVLKDSSGNVRFAVLETGQIDIEAINRLLGWKWDGLAARRSQPEELEQFWLQTKTEWLAGETTSMPSHLAQQQAQINEQYEEVNAYDQAIAEYLHQYRDCAKGWKMARSITESLGFPADRVRPVGKALASAVRRGQIESRNAGQRVIEYHWPISGSIPNDSDLTD